MPNFIPMFTSPEGEAEVMCAYQKILDKWPVSYKELTIQTSFGEDSCDRQRTAGCTAGRADPRPAGGCTVLVSKCRSFEPILPRRMWSMWLAKGTRAVP